MAEFTSFSGRKRPLTSNHARAAEFHEIPTISLQAPEKEILEQLHDACTQVGFFYIKDHGVPQEVIDQIFSTAKQFFDQPLETKCEIHYKKSTVLHGYEPINQVRTDEAKRADLNEAFNCGYEPDLDPLSATGTEPTRETKDTPTTSPMEGPNAWPALPTFKPAIAAYYGHTLTLARRLARLFALTLGMPATFFDTSVRHPGAMLRLIKYPAQSPHDPDALGIGAHTDIEAFTILCQGPSDQAALQVLNVAGQWIQAPPLAGTLVVNVGDMLARWSNDVFISTVHRVHNATGQERYSVPFFFGPSYDTVLRPLPTCVPEGEEAAYEPVVAGEYVWQRLARSRVGKEEADGRGSVKSETLV